MHHLAVGRERGDSVQNAVTQRTLPGPGSVAAVFQLCYTCAVMSDHRAKTSFAEACLCLWVIAAQIWYLLQFRPLVAFFVARFFHKS